MLRTYLFDTYTANKAGRDSTGNGERGSYRTPPSVAATNLLVAPERGRGRGPADRSGRRRALRDGRRRGCTPASIRSPAASPSGATGRLIEDGELAAPVREMTIASDLVSMLQGGRAGRLGDARWVPFGGQRAAPRPLLVRRDDRGRGIFGSRA